MKNIEATFMKSKYCFNESDDNEGSVLPVQFREHNFVSVSAVLFNFETSERKS